MPKERTLTRCLVSFAAIYLVLLFLAGLAQMYSSQEYDLNTPILFFTSFVISNRLAHWLQRPLSKTEIVILSLATFTIVVVIRLCAVAFLVQNLALAISRPFLSQLLIDFISLFIFFGYLPNRLVKNIAANDKEKSDKKKMWKIYLFCILFVGLILCAFFLTNFLPNSTLADWSFLIVLISTIALSIYFYRLLSARVNDPNISWISDPGFKKRWVRISVAVFGSAFLCLILGRSLPWLYTSIVGTEGDVLAKVTGWKSRSRGECAHPYINDIIFFAPSRGLCADRAEKSKYPEGTILRLRGKISVLGINIHQMEILDDARRFSK